MGQATPLLGPRFSSFKMRTTRCRRQGAVVPHGCCYSATTNLSATPAGSAPGSPQTLALLTAARLASQARPPLPRHVLASWRPSCFTTPQLFPTWRPRDPPTMEAGSCHRARALQRPSDGCLPASPSPLSPASNPLRPPPLSALSQTSTWLTPLSSQASAQMLPLPGSPPATLTLCIPLP